MVTVRRPYSTRGVPIGCVALGIGGMAAASMHLVNINSLHDIYIYIYI